MVSYPLFLEYVKDNILSFMPEEYRDYRVEEIRALKENGQVFTGISIVKGEKCCVPAFYCESFYKMYQETQDIDSVMRDIAEQYVHWDKVGMQMPLPDLENFEEIKDLIGYSVANERLNQEMLKDVVHTTVEDIAKVYRVFLIDDDGCKSTKITNELMKQWDISREELDAIANENMPRMFPPVVMSSKTMLMKLFDEEEELPTGIFAEPGDFLYVLTNQQLNGGASTLFYPELLQTVRQQLGNDFYILPGSTEEVYILPKDEHSPVLLGEKVRIGNQEFNQPNEILADCIYEYTKGADHIRKVPESVRQVEKNRGMER